MVFPSSWNPYPANTIYHKYDLSQIRFSPQIRFVSRPIRPPRCPTGVAVWAAGRASSRPTRGTTVCCAVQCCVVQCCAVQCSVVQCDSCALCRLRRGPDGGPAPASCPRAAQGYTRPGGSFDPALELSFALSSFAVSSLALSSLALSSLALSSLALSSLCPMPLHPGDPTPPEALPEPEALRPPDGHGGHAGGGTAAHAGAVQ